jgi:diguanylate cyclase
LRAAVRRKDEEALIDPLTGIPNRGGYERRALEEFERWQRYGAPLSLALLDVDHFKRINDEYGHSAGDKALRMIAQLLAKRLRRIDFLARYGGEEFVALLPGTSADSAFTVVDRLRARVSAAGFHYKGEPVTISLTAGVTAFGAGDTIEAVIERADAALYEGKQSGRDRTVLRAPPGSDA